MAIILFGCHRILISNTKRYSNLLPFDAFIMQFRAGTQICTSIGEQIMWTYTTDEIFANLHKTTVSDV